MALSKVKSLKQRKRLLDRIASYNSISDKTGYRKPGSNKK